MAFYQQFPAIYAYHPLPFLNQDFYAVYPGNGGCEGPMFYESVPNGNHNQGKTYGNFGKGASRKESTDSGISNVTRKTSNTSTISNLSSVILEEPSEKDDDDNKKEGDVLEKKDEEQVPYVEPDDDLCEKIVQQVEFYFSDANITKDKFLLKHVKRNKEGFVSLKLISSFKRVKHLSKDWRQVASAIERKSDKLEVNDVKTKVRRLAELPEYDETTPSRTVVALNLPLERPTIEGVAEIFGKTGDIALIRILRPGNPIPADVKPFVNKHPEMTAKVCALVEFERTEFALKAVRDLNDDTDEEGMKVMELIPPPSSKTNKNKNKLDNKNNKENKAVPIRRSSYAGQQPQQQQQQQQQARSRRISLYHNMKFEEMNQANKGLNPNAPSFQMQRRISRPPFIHPFEMMQFQQHHQAAAAAAASLSPNGIPAWMAPRRMFGGDNSGSTTSGLTLPPNVIRLPRGPAKGSKGFNNWCRSRMTVNSPQEKKSHAVPIVAPVEPKKEVVVEEVEEEEQQEKEVEEEEQKKQKGEEEQEPSVPQQIAQAAALHPPVIIINNDDSGNEDDGFSDEPAINERTR